jgi:hypothetical protein
MHHYRRRVDDIAKGFPLLSRAGCAELLAEPLGRFFLAFANFAAIKDDIVLVHGAVNLDGAEREFVETHTRTPCTLASRALLRRDDGKGGPALLDFLAAAVRADDLSVFVVDEGQDSGEEFFAIVAEKFVMGHTDLLGEGVLGKF